MINDFDILVIEDEPVVIESAKKILLTAGLTVDEATDAETALHKLENNEYKLILSDLMLPKISGFELIETLRISHPSIPIIVITGFATIDNAIKSLRLGSFDFIPKPFAFEELLGVVNRAIRFAKLTEGSGLDENYMEHLHRQGIIEAKPEKYYFLGQHSWAKLDKDGSAMFGVGETFPGSVADIQRIDVSHINEEIIQGNIFAWITTRQQLVHNVWAPLSGNVIEHNREIEQDSNLINTDPFCRGWLIRIIPANLENELANLVLR